MSAPTWDMIGAATSSTRQVLQANVLAAAAGLPLAFPNVYSILSAQAATFNTTLNHSGFIYGGQAGHNWLVHNMFWTWDGVLGVEVDFQGKSDSHSTTLTSLDCRPPFPATGDRRRRR